MAEDRRTAEPEVIVGKPRVWPEDVTIDFLKFKCDALLAEVERLQADVDGWIRISAQNAKDANTREDILRSQVVSAERQRDEALQALREMVPFAETALCLKPECPCGQKALLHKIRAALAKGGV